MTARTSPSAAARLVAAAAAIAAALWTAPGHADAPPVVLMVDPGRRVELADAMRVELAGRDVEILELDPPEGATSLARAAAAQAGARFVGALAAVYVEGTAPRGATVRAVGPDGDLVRQAPLPHPMTDVDAGVFAVVAHSLIEELIGPPETPVTVRVQVSVDAPGREVTGSGRVTGRAVEGEVRLDGAATSAATAAPAAPVTTETPRAAPVHVPSTPPTPMRRTAPAEWVVPSHPVDGGAWEEDGPLLPRDGFFLEGGGVFAGVGGGGQLGLGWQLGEQLRLSARTAVMWLFDDTTAYMPSLELARIGPDRSGRLDFGGGLGMVFIDGVYDDGWGGRYDVVRVGWVGQVFVGWTWELGGVGLGARGALAVAGIEQAGPIVAPMATLHAELPL